MLKIGILLLLITLIFLAIKSKIFLNQQRQKELPETIVSPFSQALTQLLGIAGGIYLSLIMLGSFLSLYIPEKITILNWSVDPLALFSLLIALVQPLFLRLIKIVNNWR